MKITNLTVEIDVLRCLGTQNVTLDIRTWTHGHYIGCKKTVRDSDLVPMIDPIMEEIKIAIIEEAKKVGLLSPTNEFIPAKE